MPSKKEYKFLIKGQPLPRPRPRVTRRGIVYFPKIYQDYLKSITDIIGWKFFDKEWTPFQKDVSLSVLFKRKDKKRADIDNLLKVVMEALEKSTLLINDNQITYLKNVGVIYGVKQPCTQIRIWE